MHGRIYIILKESLKNVPIFGWGAQFYNFIFLSRKWETDKSRFQRHLSQLSNPKDPMWLLIFPEGTNLSETTRAKSKAWAEKQGINDMKHQLLPRKTGLQFCLQRLKESTNWLYDCTIAYEGVPYVSSYQLTSNLADKRTGKVSSDRIFLPFALHSLRVVRQSLSTCTGDDSRLATFLSTTTRLSRDGSKTAGLKRITSWSTFIAMALFLPDVQSKPCKPKLRCRSSQMATATERRSKSSSQSTRPPNSLPPKSRQADGRSSSPSLLLSLPLQQHFRAVI